MRDDSRKYLWDALQAADRIQRFSAGKCLRDYLNDELLRAGVERQFEIIGEALGKLRTIDATTASRIPELGRIVAFRNILIHGYANVDDELVWGIVEGKLASLSKTLRDLLTIG
jgi:uncharacterized protein with HEPN domain